MSIEPTGGPPRCERPAPIPGNRPIHNHTAPEFSGKELVWVPCTRPPAPQDIASQLRRRRAAAHRSVPLACGHRDPWPDCSPTTQVTDHQLDAWRRTVEHLHRAGFCPVVPAEVKAVLHG